MAYPAGTRTLAACLYDVDQVALNLKSSAQRLRNDAAAGPLDLLKIVRFFDEGVNANNAFETAEAVTGLGAYAQNQKGDATLNVVTEFNAMQAALIVVLDYLRTSVLPEGTFGGQQYKLAYRLPAGNTTASVLITFTIAQTATLRTHLDGLIATVS